MRALGRVRGGPWSQNPQEGRTFGQLSSCQWEVSAALSWYYSPPHGLRVQLSGHLLHCQFYAPLPTVLLINDVPQRGRYENTTGYGIEYVFEHKF